MPRESDYPVLLPGQSLVISLDATMRLSDGQIDWSGSQGLLGYWNVTRSAAPYRFRLRYRQMESTTGPFQGQFGTSTGLWVGEGTTDAVTLPIKFAD